MDRIHWYIIVAVFVLMVFTFILYEIVSLKRLEKLKRYRKVKIGMSKTEMLSIMGRGYSKSLLKNKRVKYEWRINAISYGSSYRGVSHRSYSGVKKVSIYTQNGYVEEVRAHNI